MTKDDDLTTCSSSEGWDESKCRRDERGRFAKKNGKKKMTPAEKIASVHIDFTRDNILPELNEDSLEKMGLTENKKVLVKKEVIDRNAERHGDLSQDDFQMIISEALYSEKTEIFPANKEKPNYYHFAKIVKLGGKYAMTLLDVDGKKDNFEVVHAHFVYTKDLERARKKGK